MSKITFRADADLVDRLEGLEGSKSEVMREALRDYLDDTERGAGAAVGGAADAGDGTAPHDDASVDGDPLDAALAARVNELVSARLDREFGAGASDAPPAPRPFGVPEQPSAVNLTVNVDGTDAATESSDATAAVEGDAEPARGTAADAESDAEDPTPGESACGRCGETVAEGHVYCPNCGEKATRRAFCECGDEVRSDWAFCPGCGRRTAAADVLDRQ
ncbi:double zinc ribbon domain-containing protein [Halobaculum lipolyticum]|uniref:Zinc ribbon domain-containing protein n=1 Tax=Halobaculum lipolyticum TaxID=3032001 RepID=A0ABD5W952_9EURY|nr:zinc ribbon domain-containing protein [Halobaculum sp. DT31]